jgi:cell wall-associated NlpC family hydrolase
VTFADIVTSMQQIQAQLALLQNGSAPSSVTAAANASSFAGALDDATAATGTTATTATGSTVASGSVTGKDVVQDAMQYVGTPYVLGGESKSGMDCSGLVQRAFADLGVKVPRLVHEQQTIGQAVPSLKDAKPGDLIVLNGGDHIAIYAGNNTVVHAPYEGRTVSVQKAWFTDKDIVTIRRVVPSEATPTAAATSTSAVVQAASLASALGGLSSGESLKGAAADGSSDTSLSSLLSSIGASGTASTGTTQQLLAARAAMLEGAA